MSAQFGHDGIAGIYFGSDKINKIYFGNQLIYSLEDEPVLVTLDQGDSSPVLEISYPDARTINSLTLLQAKRTWETPECKVVTGYSIDDFINADSQTQYNIGETFEKDNRSISFSQDLDNPVVIDGHTLYETTYTLSTPINCTPGTSYLVLARIGQYTSVENRKIAYWSRKWSGKHRGYSQYIADVCIVDGNYGKWKKPTKLDNPPWVIRNK